MGNTKLTILIAEECSKMKKKLDNRILEEGGTTLYEKMVRHDDVMFISDGVQFTNIAIGFPILCYVFFLLFFSFIQFRV